MYASWLARIDVLQELKLMGMCLTVRVRVQALQITSHPFVEHERGDVHVLRLYLELHQTFITTPPGGGLEKSAPDSTLLVYRIYSDAPEHPGIIAVFEHDDARGAGRHGCGADKRSRYLHRGILIVHTVACLNPCVISGSGLAKKYRNESVDRLPHVDHGSG